MTGFVCAVLAHASSNVLMTATATTVTALQLQHMHCMHATCEACQLLCPLVFSGREGKLRKAKKYQPNASASQLSSFNSPRGLCRQPQP